MSETMPWEDAQKASVAESSVRQETMPWEDAQTASQQPAAPPASPVKFMDWNLQKALRNQGVDPATMEVVDPAKDWGFFKKVVRSIGSGNAEFKMDVRMGQAAESEVDIYASVRSDELLYERAVKANPIISHNIIVQDIFNTARAWGFYTAGGGDIEIMGGVAIGLVMAFAIIKYFHKNSALRA